MPVEVILPRVDMDMERGKLTAWFAADGDSVVKGQPLFEIETDKAAMEVEAPASGVLRCAAAEPGEIFAVGAVIGQIFPPGEEASAPVQARATPKARRLAREAGVDLASLRGGGPQGRVQARDVPAPAATQPAHGLHREWLARGARAPLVLVHGFGADLNVWRRWIAHLPPGRGALALDLPGHGRSPLDEPIEVERFAAALAATLDAEGIGRAHLVAHSLGAATAAALAALRPERVASLTLIAPAGFGPDINGAFLTGFLAARSAAALRPWLSELAAAPAVLGDALAETTLRQRRDLGVGETQARIAAALFPDGAQVFSARPALAAYRGPAKLIFGRADRIVPVRHARGLPGSAALHILDGVGHMPHLEARDLCARLARENAAAGDEAATG